MATTITTETTPYLPTNEEMLSEINKAILAVISGGQSYTIGSRKLTRADLAQLYKMKQEIESLMAADEQSGNGLIDDCYVAVFPFER